MANIVTYCLKGKIPGNIMKINRISMCVPEYLRCFEKMVRLVCYCPSIFSTVLTISKGLVEKNYCFNLENNGN